LMYSEYGRGMSHEECHGQQQEGCYE
jgi:hypothetical protein